MKVSLNRLTVDGFRGWVERTAGVQGQSYPMAILMVGV